MCSGIDNNSIISQRRSFVKNKNNIFLFEQQEKIPLYSFAELNSKKITQNKKNGGFRRAHQLIPKSHFVLQ